MTPGTTAEDRLTALSRAGLVWHPSGRAALRGPLLRLADACDQAFARLAELWRAEEERHPAALPAEALHRTSHLRAFPHHLVLAAPLDPDPAGLAAFADGPVLDGRGALTGARPAPLTDVLLSSACPPVYAARAGERLSAPAYLTVRATCFRTEAAYAPLHRMSSFTMRETVCLGTGPETSAFLDRAGAAVTLLCEHLDLPVTWRRATDPFFRPEADPRHLMQRLEPLKREAAYGDLALASVNRHHEHFGAAFGLLRDGAPAHTACLAFGVERWLYALTDRYGTDPGRWPDPPAAADAVYRALAGARS